MTVRTSERNWDLDIRKCYNETCLSAIIKFLSEFRPTATYIGHLLSLESNAKSNSQKGALYKMKFGSVKDPENQTPRQRDEIELQISQYKSRSTQILDQIGLFSHQLV